MKRICDATRRTIKTISIAATATLFLQPAGYAQTIIDEWAAVQAPAAPALKAVKVDPKTSALLVLDLLKQSCNAERRPRCVASIPNIVKLLDGARTHHVTVFHSRFPGPKPEDVLPEVAPKGEEPSVSALADKFIGTDLEKMLKDKGITTVIIVGTAAHGAVLYTAGSAAMRGFEVVVPVDGASSENTYAEQVTAWLLTNAPTISSKVSLTKIDLIGY